MSYQKVPRSSRIRKDVLEALGRRAEETGMTVNSLLNRYLMEGPILDALRQYIDALFIGMEIVLGLMERWNEEDLEKFGAKMGGTIAKRLFTAYSTEPNMKNVIWALSQVYSRICNWFAFRHNLDERGVHQLIFTHNRGVKWTAFLKGYLTALLNSLLNIEPKVNVSNVMLEFIINEKSGRFTGMQQAK